MLGSGWDGSWCYWVAKWHMKKLQVWLTAGIDMVNDWHWWLEWVAGAGEWGVGVGRQLVLRVWQWVINLWVRPGPRVRVSLKVLTQT